MHACNRLASGHRSLHSLPTLSTRIEDVCADRAFACAIGVNLPLLYGHSVVLTVSLIQEGLADMKRHRSDDEVSRL